MKAIFFDIDGTILYMQKGIDKIRPAVFSAMKDLQAAGHKIFLATGRPYAFIYDNILKVDFDGMITCNGACIIHGDQLVYSKPIDSKIVLDVIHRCEAKNLEYVLESYPEVYLPKNSPVFEDFYKKIQIPISYNVVRDFDVENVANGKIYKIESFTTDSHAEKTYRELMALPGLTGVIDPAHFSNVELYSDSQSKATGILKVLEHLNIPIEESYAFGDGLNDIEMMQTVGHALVMGNAQDALKPYAEHILPTVFDDGVAFGIRNYILKEGSA